MYVVVHEKVCRDAATLVADRRLVVSYLIDYSAATHTVTDAADMNRHLLLLENCLTNAQKLEHREREARLQGQNSKAEYLHKLRRHYQAMQESLTHEIFKSGVTPDELLQRLADLDRRLEPRSDPASGGDDASLTEESIRRVCSPAGEPRQ